MTEWKKAHWSSAKQVTHLIMLLIYTPFRLVNGSNKTSILTAEISWQSIVAAPATDKPKLLTAKSCCRNMQCSTFCLLKGFLKRSSIIACQSETHSLQPQPLCYLKQEPRPFIQWTGNPTTCFSSRAQCSLNMWMGLQLIKLEQHCSARGTEESQSLPSAPLKPWFSIL